MNQSTSCPVCTLYLREGITLQTHLETHPKDQVIEALLKITSGGTAIQSGSSCQSAAGSVPVGTFMPAQSYVAPNTAFLSSSFSTPQTQVTAAVTYQQFVTSNGSAVMPQYIQVPTIVAPNSSMPLIPNSTLNCIPNQSNTYAHTMYNPLYNPYIPQPYPLIQPVYTTLPVTSDSNTQVSSSYITNSVVPVSNIQTSSKAKSDSGLKKVSTVATNTVSNKVTKSSSTIKKLPLKSSTQAKFRILKQLDSHAKIGCSTNSTMATVATKSYKITSVNSKINSIAKTSIIARANSIKNKTQLIASEPSFSSDSEIITPPPLTSVTRSRSSSLSQSDPSPPSLTAISSSYDLRDFMETEKASTDSGRLDEACENIEGVAEYLLHPSVNSVILESNSGFQITNNIMISNSTEDEHDDDSSNYGGESDLPQIDCESTLGEKQSHFSVNRVSENFDFERNPCEEFDKDQQLESDANDNNSINNNEEEEEEEELADKVFHCLDIEEEKKVAFNIDVDNQDIPKEISSANLERNCDGSDIFIQEENIPFSRIGEDARENRRSPSVITENPAMTFQSNDSTEKGNLSSNKERCIEEGAKSAETEKQSNAGISQPADTCNINDLKSLTYTDLQPATNIKILQDLGISTSININNFMEVDGIRIFINNGNTQNVPLEPIIKFTSSVKTDVTNIQNFMKSENEARDSNALVESVIQLVSGGTVQKNSEPLPSDSCTNSNSRPSDDHLDLPELSPLTLNIQADESMPARGELSEQESLGAENSNWGLFHSENINRKVLEPWKTDPAPEVVSLSGEQNEKPIKRSFKRSFCEEVFSCPKEKRLNRGAADEIEKCGAAVPRKAKTFGCTHCTQVFDSQKDRKLHVIQNHYFDAGNSCNKIKMEFEVKDGSSAQGDCQDIEVPGGAVKRELDQGSVKCEAAMGSQGNKPCEEKRNCPKCNLPLNGMKKLKDHLKEVHGISRYKCPISEPVPRYKCLTCSETFDLEQDYISHLRIHPLACKQCGKTFYRKPNLNLHLRRHLVVKPYACTLCPKTFITRQKLEEHVNGHSGLKPIKCSLCDSTFSRYSNLIQHRKIHHVYGKKKVKDFVCRCGEVFHSLRKLQWHKEIHDRKPKACPFCSQKFIHSNSVTRHVRRSHVPDYLPVDKKDLENVRCPICEKIYLRSSLIVHMRVHNGEKPFGCKVCNKHFTTKWNLELHTWTHQSRNNMPFKCTICKSAFFREVDYVAHLNAHRNFRPFTCNVCGQKFIRKYNCLRHQEEHKKEKKFVCTVSGCEKSFHRSYYLRDHMKVHTGVRPHTCHICGKASSTKSNHNKHIRIHDTREPVNTEN